MTASGPGVPGRGITADDAPRRGIVPSIAAILVIGLIVRLIMAYGIPLFVQTPLAGSGFRNDLDLFRFWASDLGQHGPFGFYDRGFFADYTPGYLYALWAVGVVGSFVGGVGDLIKLPSILTDVALAWVVYLMVRDLGAGERRARLAAVVVLVNPITWFDSVVWGQVDSFGTVFLLLAIRELWRGRGSKTYLLVQKIDMSSVDPRDKKPPETRRFLTVLEGTEPGPSQEIPAYDHAAGANGLLVFLKRGSYRIFDGARWAEEQTDGIGKDPRGDPHAGRPVCVEQFRDRPPSPAHRTRQGRRCPPAP